MQQASLIGGTGLLLMAILSGVAIMGILDALVIRGDVARTAVNVTAEATRFRVAIAGMVVVAVLDIIVAWALYVLFRPVDEGLAVLALWFRLLYTAVLVAGIGHLATGLQMLTTAGTAGAAGIQQSSVLALLEFEAFYNTWDVGLVLIGIHLVLVGWLVGRAEYAPTSIGVLVVIAGLGYLLDSFVAILTTGIAVEVTMVTFVGEVVLLAWLLYRGIRNPLPVDGKMRPVDSDG